MERVALGVQADIDDGQREGVRTATLRELAPLKAEDRRLRETDEVLQRSSIFFTRELDPRSR